jgi:hypothetical protein
MAEQTSIVASPAGAGSDAVPTDDQLVAELRRLGIRHLRCRVIAEDAELASATLVVGLARSSDARLRAALLPLFLWRPDLADPVKEAARQLDGRSLATLQCFYSAAVVLQEFHSERLDQLGGSRLMLSDLFSASLDLPATDNDTERLAAIGDRHARLTGDEVNWVGTYLHVVDDFLLSAGMKAESTL